MSDISDRSDAPRVSGPVPEPIDEAQLLQIVRGYRSRHIPLDAFALDFDWKAWGEDRYGEFRWNALDPAIRAVEVRKVYGTKDAQVEAWWLLGLVGQEHPTRLALVRKLPQQVISVCLVTERDPVRILQEVRSLGYL